jgi:hypothetical protein
MVYDCFTFFNELDLLEIRLNTLDAVVDKFVIAEATRTHTGKHKDLVFKLNQSRFARFLDKIIYVEADMSIMILEGEGPNGTAVTSKYYMDNQDGGRLKRLRLQAKNEKEVVCATISTYNDDGIEESLSTEQNLDNGDIYFSKATRDLKRPEVIKIERMKQVKDELTKMPDIYQFRLFMPALEDIYPDRDVVDPFDIMHFSILGMQ